MSLIFERIYTDGIAELSYPVGNDSEGVAAVFDPRPEHWPRNARAANSTLSGA